MRKVSPPIHCQQPSSASSAQATDPTKAIDRRDDWMRRMEPDRLAMSVEHEVRLAVVQRPLLASRLRESLPLPISRRSLRHKCYRRHVGSLQNCPRYTMCQRYRRDFVQYSSAFQLVMTKKESRHSSCPEWRLRSLALTARRPAATICYFVNRKDRHSDAANNRPPSSTASTLQRPIWASGK